MPVNKIWSERWEEFHSGGWNVFSYARSLGIKPESVERSLYRQAKRLGVSWSPTGSHKR